MMGFNACGHKNITAKHKNTLEFTKDRTVTENGDCIIGVCADFSLKALKGLKGKVKVTIRAGDAKEEINAFVNNRFNDNHELVIRKSSFGSERTFAINADKAAINLNRGLVAHLKAGRKVRVEITTN